MIKITERTTAAVRSLLGAATHSEDFHLLVREAVWAVKEDPEVNDFVGKIMSSCEQMKQKGWYIHVSESIQPSMEGKACTPGVAHLLSEGVSPIGMFERIQESLFWSAFDRGANAVGAGLHGEIQEFVGHICGGEVQARLRQIPAGVRH